MNPGKNKNPKIANSRELESILGLPLEKIKEIYKEHLRIMSKGTEEEKEKIENLHILKSIFGSSHKDISESNIIEALLEEQKKKDILPDNVTEDIVRKILESPTFEVLYSDLYTVRELRNMGFQAVASTVFEDKNGGKRIAKTFFNYMTEPKAKERAEKAQEFVYHLTDYLMQTLQDEKVLHIISKFSPKHPRKIARIPLFSNITQEETGRILANTFLDDMTTLHDYLSGGGASYEERYIRIKDLNNIGIILGYYGNKFRDLKSAEYGGEHCTSFSKGRKILAGDGCYSKLLDYIRRYKTGAGDYVIKDVDRKNRDLQKLVMRTNKKLKRALVEEKIADKNGKVIDEKRFADAYPKEYMFFSQFNADIAAPLACQRNYFSMGDRRPMNDLLSEERYSAVDFEWACFEPIQTQLVERMIKSGIYDHNGNAIKIRGRSIENMLLDDAFDIFSHLEPSADKKSFIDGFRKLKMEAYLLWAARYKEFADNGNILNPEDSRKVAQYTYTLAIREMKKNGLDDLLEATRPLFDNVYGTPLHEDEMERIHDMLNPETCSISFLKPDIQSMEIQQLGIKEQHQKIRKKDMRKKFIVASAVLAILAVGAFGSYKQCITIKRNRAAKELSGLVGDYNHNRIMEGIKFYGDIPGTERYKALRQMFNDMDEIEGNMAARAAFFSSYDNKRGERAVRLAMELAGKKKFIDYAKYLNPDVPLKVFSVDYADRFMMQTIIEDNKKIEQDAADDPLARSIRSEVRVKSIREANEDMGFDYRMSFLEDSYKSQAKAISEGKLTKSDFVTKEDIRAACETKINCRLLEGIIDYYNSAVYNPFKDIKGYEGTFMMDPVLARDHDSISPKKHLDEAVGRLIKVLLDEGINPLNPQGIDSDKDRKKLDKALAVYFSYDFEIKKAKEKQKSIGGDWRSFLSGQATDPAHYIIEKVYGF